MIQSRGSNFTFPPYSYHPVIPVTFAKKKILSPPFCSATFIIHDHKCMSFYAYYSVLLSIYLPLHQHSHSLNCYSFRISFDIWSGKFFYRAILARLHFHINISNQLFKLQKQTCWNFYWDCTISKDQLGCLLWQYTY